VLVDGGGLSAGAVINPIQWHEIPFVGHRRGELEGRHSDATRARWRSSGEAEREEQLSMCSAASDAPDKPANEGQEEKRGEQKEFPQRPLGQQIARANGASFGVCGNHRPAIAARHELHRGAASFIGFSVLSSICLR
jgi:hypothetical protein